MKPLSSFRTRWVFVACLLTLGMSVGAVGSIVFIRWQADRSTRSDTQLILDQVAQQLIQTLESRRETFSLLQDALEKAPNLDDAQRMALVKSAADRTPDLVGSGLMQKRGLFLWWIPPATLVSQEREWLRMIQDVTKRTWLRTNMLRLPSMLTVSLEPQRPLLVLIEPSRSKANPFRRVITFLDLQPFLEGFFNETFRRPLPVQVRERENLLYRSRRWVPSGRRGQERSFVERPIHFEGIRWMLEMQRAAPPMVPRAWLNLLGLAILVVAGSATAGMLWSTERLRQLATTDELTGLYNRRLFLERLEGEVERAKRYGRNLSCLMIDVNGFKKVNDVLGHPMGDAVLKQVAQDLRGCLRKTDLLARFGGDEFTVALPETNLQQAETVAEKLRGALIEGPWLRHRFLIPLSLSVGLSQMHRGDSAQEIIQRADTDLYVSRQNAQQQQFHPVIPLKTA